MKKEIHPAAAVIAVVIALLLVISIYYKQTEPPKPMPMNPLGPGAAALQKHGGNLANVMTPAEKRMVAHSLGNRAGSQGSQGGSQGVFGGK